MASPALDRRGLGTRFLRDERGAVLVFSGVFLTVALGCTALAVDLGHLWLAKRQLQASADLAAIAAVRAGLDAAATATVAGNGVTDATAIDIAWGVYTPDESVVLPADRFVADPGSTTAAQVTVTRPVSMFFGALFDPSGVVELTASGTAARRDEATISIGSFLFKLERGLLNQVLAPLTGSSATLTAMHYDGLLAGEVELLGVLEELATTASIEALDYDDVLDANVTVGQLLTAMAAASDPGDLATALTALGGAITSGANLALSSIIDLGEIGSVTLGAGSQALNVSVADFLGATLETANGVNQLALSTDLTIAGLTSVHADLAIGERPASLPWIANGPAGVTVRTAQTRLKLEIGLLGGSGLLSGLAIRVPLYFEIASAAATIEDVTCDVTEDGSTAVEVDAGTAVAEAWLGDVTMTAMNDFSARPTVSPAALVTVAVPVLLTTVAVKVKGSSHVNAGSPATQAVVLGPHAGDMETIGSTGIVGSTMSSLLGNLTLTTELPLELSGLVDAALQPLLAPLLQLVGNTLAAALLPADDLIDAALASLGITLGGADLRLDHVSCGDARLVI